MHPMFLLYVLFCECELILCLNIYRDLERGHHHHQQLHHNRLSKKLEIFIFTLMLVKKFMDTNLG